MGAGVGRINKGKTSKRARRRRQDARAVDQICEDIANPKRVTFDIDLDLPGLGQFYCIQCARHFISAAALATHRRTKVHKARVKELREKPYSQAEAEAAAGMAPPDNGTPTT